jgi:hypothetical protein
MARVIDTFPAPKVTSLYPWDQWLDGQVWELVAGEDFNAKPQTIRQNAAAQATKRSGRVKTRLLEDGERQVVVIQFERRR